MYEGHYFKSFFLKQKTFLEKLNKSTLVEVQKVQNDIYTVIWHNSCDKRIEKSLKPMWKDF